MREERGGVEEKEDSEAPRSTLFLDRSCLNFISPLIRGDRGLRRRASHGDSGAEQRRFLRRDQADRTGRAAGRRDEVIEIPLAVGSVVGVEFYHGTVESHKGVGHLDLRLGLGGERRVPAKLPQEFALRLGLEFPQGEDGGGNNGSRATRDARGKRLESGNIGGGGRHVRGVGGLEERACILERAASTIEGQIDDKIAQETLGGCWNLRFDEGKGLGVE